MAIHYGDLRGSENVLTFDRNDMIDNGEEQLSSGLNCLSAVDGSVAAQNLLKNFGIANEFFLCGYEPFQSKLRFGSMRMRRANQVHRNIGVDEDQL